MTKRNIRRGQRVGGAWWPYLTLNSVSYSFKPPTIPAGTLVTGQTYHLTGLQGMLSVIAPAAPVSLPPFSTCRGGFNAPYAPLDIKITARILNDKTQCATWRASSQSDNEADDGLDDGEELHQAHD